MTNVADWLPWGIMTFVGETVAIPGALELTSTTTDSSLDGRFKITVQLELLPHTTVSGDKATLATAGGTTSTEVVRVFPA